MSAASAVVAGADSRINPKSTHSLQSTGAREMLPVFSRKKETPTGSSSVARFNSCRHFTRSIARRVRVHGASRKGAGYRQPRCPFLILAGSGLGSVDIPKILLCLEPTTTDKEHRSYKERNKKRNTKLGVGRNFSRRKSEQITDSCRNEWLCQIPFCDSDGSLLSCGVSATDFQCYDERVV